MPSTLSLTLSLWLALLSTCCIAWGSPYKRSYSYIPPLDFSDFGPPNQWNVAAEPESYEQPEDDYYALPMTDEELFSQLYDMQQPVERPIWGQIVNEQPEDELRALKRSGFNPPTYYRTAADIVSPPPPAPISRASTLAPPQVKQFLSETRHQFPPFRGQKEVPMLRPPNKPKSDKIALSPDTLASASTTPSPEPTIISAQITSGERQKKPSPYDTLRKYLSIEDALKKEAEKRRAGNRFQKRSNIVAEERSLTGQLRNLKKHLA